MEVEVEDKDGSCERRRRRTGFASAAESTRSPLDYDCHRGEAIDDGLALGTSGADDQDEFLVLRGNF